MLRIKNVTTGELLEIVGDFQSERLMCEMLDMLNYEHRSGCAHVDAFHNGEQQKYALVLEPASGIGRVF